MRRTQGYIPRNLGGGTIWDGRLKIRNTIEAVIVCFAVYLFTKLLGLFLPYLVVITTRLVLWVLLGGLTLHGAYGEPLSIFLLNMINYSNTRTYVTLRPPLRDLPEDEKKRRRLEKKMERTTLADRIFTKRPKHAKNNTDTKEH